LNPSGLRWVGAGRAGAGGRGVAAPGREAGRRGRWARVRAPRQHVGRRAAVVWWTGGCGVRERGAAHRPVCPGHPPFWPSLLDRRRKQAEPGRPDARGSRVADRVLGGCRASPLGARRLGPAASNVPGILDVLASCCIPESLHCSGNTQQEQVQAHCCWELG
jgi:hypothetical protein